MNRYNFNILLKIKYFFKNVKKNKILKIQIL